MLFWINSGENRRIMSASMNGRNVRILVQDHLDSPTGLAIDYFKNNRVYWCDPKMNIIESINFDGKTNYSVLFKLINFYTPGTDRLRITHTNMYQPLKIDIFENHVYWLTDDQDGMVSKVDKYGRGARIQLIQGLDLVEDIKVYHNFKVPTTGKS